MSPTPDYDLGTARGRIELDASSLGRASAAFTSLGRGMLGFGAVTVGAFVYAAKTAATFEHQMSAVAAVSQATTADMVRLKQAALDMGSSTVFSATEVGRAMEQLAKAGIGVEDILGGASEAVVALAAAAGDELAGGLDSAAVVMANAMKTFNVGADQAMHFADVLVAAAASSTLSVDDIATSLTYVGPAAASMGLSIDDLSAALAILGDRNIRGSTAGTSLRGVLLSLATQTPKATKVMKRLGLITEDGANQFFNLDGSMKPLPEVMQLLGDATKNLGDQERFAAFNAIFQRRAMNAAMILAEQGATGFNKYAAAIAKLDAASVAAKKLDNLSGDMTILKNSVNALIIQTGMQFQDMLRGWVQGLTEVVQWLRELDPVIAGNVLKFGAFTGVIVGALGAMSLMIGAGIRMYRNFKLLAEGIKLVFGAMRLLTASLLLNPWFLLIAALAALVGAMIYAYNHSREFRDAINNAFERIKAVVLPIIELVKRGIEALVTAFNTGEISGEGGLIGFLERLGVAARAVYDFFTGTFLDGIAAFFDALAGGGTTGSSGFIGFMERLGQSVRDFALWIRDVGIPALVDFAQAAGDVAFDALVAVLGFLTDEVFPRVAWVAREVSERVVSAFNWLVDNVGPVFSAFGELVAAVIGRIVDLVVYFGPAFAGAFEMVKMVIGVLLATFQTFFGIVTNLWSIFADNIWNAIVIAWDLILGTIENALRLIQGFIQIWTGILTGDWGKFWDGLRNTVGAVWDQIKELVTTAVDLVGLIIVTALDIIHAAWDTFWAALAHTVKVIFGVVVFTLKTAFDVIRGMFSNLLGAIVGLWDGTFGKLVTLVAGALGRISSAVNTGFVSVIGFFSNLWTRITGALGDLAGKLYNFFNAAMIRAKDGVIVAALQLYDFFTQLPGNIISWLGNLGSMLFNAGKAIVQGFIDGIKSMIGAVKDAFGSVTGAIGRVVPGSPVKEGPLRIFNKGYAGAELIRMLMRGIESQIPTLQQMLNSIMPTVDLTAAGATGAATVATPRAAQSVDNSVHIGEVSIPVKDLEELKTVQDFFDRVGQVARQGVRT